MPVKHTLQCICPVLHYSSSLFTVNTVCGCVFGCVFRHMTPFLSTSRGREIVGSLFIWKILKVEGMFRCGGECGLYRTLWLLYNLGKHFLPSCFRMQLFCSRLHHNTPINDYFPVTSWNDHKHQVFYSLLTTPVSKHFMAYYSKEVEVLLYHSLCPNLLAL